MNHLKKLLLVLLISVFAVADSFAGGQDRAGTSAAPELRIPVGGRYLAMGGANVASAVGLEAMYWNPAGVSINETSANALFSYRSYLADMSMQYAAVSGNFEGLGTIALSFRDLNVGQIPVTTVGQPDGTGEIFSPTYFILGLTYARALTDRVAIGVNFNLISERWASVSTSGFSVDAGVQYRNLLDVPNLAIGVVVKNLGGSMKYDGTALWVQNNDPNSDRGITFYKVGTQSFSLPSEISLGISYSRQIDEENTLSFAGAFVNNNYSYDDYKVGMEYSYKDILFLRGGYLKSPDASPNTNPNIFQGFSFGAGLNFKDFTDINLSVDYAYIPVKFFSSSNAVTVRFGF